MAPLPAKLPPNPTCETDSEDDLSSTPRPDASKKKSHSSASSATTRRDSKVGSRRPADKNSDSGYSTGTKGSADTGHSAWPPAEKTESAQAPSASPTKSSRSTKEKRLSSSKSQMSQRSSAKSAPAPSRAPSTKSRSSASSDKKKEEKRHSRHSDHAAPPSALHSAVGTSPTSSRSSRTPSSSSQEMPPPASTGHSRPRSYSQTRSHRPASYHAGMGPIEPMYPLAYYERGPPPSRSAYVDKGAHLVRPPLAMLPPASTYTPTMPHQALQPSMYDPSRMAVRAQTDYSPASGGIQYSARRQNVVYPDQPASYDPSSMHPPSPPSRSRSRQRAPVNPRKPVEISMFEDDSEHESEPDDDYDIPGARYIPIRRPSVQEKRSSWGPRGTRGMYTPYGTSPYGTSPYGPSPYGTSPAAEFPAYDTRYDDAYAAQFDYRPSARSNTITSSSRSRHASVASSGGGTRGTSYSPSSGSGTYTGSNRQRSLYEHPRGNMPLDLSAQAEMYMKTMDRQAHHVRHQQPPQLTQESLRLSQTRAIDGKRSSKGGVTPSVVSSSYANSLRSRTVTANDDQAVKVLINTSAGIDLAVEGDTEGRPIRLVQKPGEETAQLYIGTGPGRREETVYYNGDNSRSSGRSRVASKSGSSKAAVSGRRGRARTAAE